MHREAAPLIHFAREDVAGISWNGSSRLKDLPVVVHLMMTAGCILKDPFWTKLYEQIVGTAHDTARDGIVISPTHCVMVLSHT